MDVQKVTVSQKKNELETAKEGLLERLRKWTENQGVMKTAVEGLVFVRHDSIGTQNLYMQEPGICLVAQRSKRLLLGGECFEYDANHYLITAMDVPVIAEITGASKDEPYLGLTLKIDRAVITQLMADSSLPPVKRAPAVPVMTVSELTLPLLSALLRLIDLLEEPESIPVLAAAIKREIFYRLLVNEQGPQLRQICITGSYGYQIGLAVGWLKKNFAESLRIEDLAKLCNMSISSFHHNFKALTAMSPLQYQKMIRLQEARNLMLAEHYDAAEAAFKVGYESPSQFSREYSRFFKTTPVNDIKMLKKTSK
jgi:AraC-like DNA-binding protein